MAGRRLLTNTGVMVRFILRRDRVRLLLWLVLIVLFTLSMAAALPGLYPSELERQVLAATMDNPAMTAMVGKPYGIDSYTFGAMIAHQMLLLSAVVAAIMNILLAARHTRSDEENGRVELLRALPLGRLSGLHAAAATLAAVNAALAVATGLGLYVLGIESVDLQGSLLYGAALGASGFMFAALTMLFAQLSASSRGTVGLSFAALLAFYMLRAAGDIGDGAVSWLSPLGWTTRVKAYAGNDWRPIALLLIASAALIALAYWLNAARDLGSGLLAERPGRARASALLRGPLSLALRLQRAGLVAWGIGVVAIGGAYGSVFGDLDAYFSSSETIQLLLPAGSGSSSLIEPFIAMLMSVTAILCAIPALLVILKLAREESGGRVDQVLSRAVSRQRLLGSYAAIAWAAGPVMLLLSAAGMGAASLAVLPDGPGIGVFIAAAMVYIPAVWALVGLAALLVGAAPRWSWLVWPYVVFSFIVIYTGDLLRLPSWLQGLSPFAHTPQLPVEPMAWRPTVVVTVIAAALAVAGFAAYRRRDIYG